MDPNLYRVIHVLAVILLAGLAFAAFANPAQTAKRKVLLASGVCSLLALIAGFGLVAKLGVPFPFPTWILVKLGCWLGLSAMAGLAYRQPKNIPWLAGISIALLLLALCMVYYRGGLE